MTQANSREAGKMGRNFEHGYIEDWTEDMARTIADREGLSLTQEHLDILHIMRDFYKEFKLSPVRKLLKKHIARKLGPEKSTDDYLDNMFPNSVLVQGTRIAGIPVPLLDAELEQSVYTRTAESVSDSPKHFIGEFEFEGKTYKVYPHGNLVNAEEWNEKIANVLAEKEGITLTPEHWEVLNYLRKHYFQYGISPMVKLLVKYMKEKLGEDKASQEYLYRLFPDGPSRQGSRIAGLPEPQGCIDP